MRGEYAISRIISAIFSNKVAVRENLFYDTVKGDLDFADDDLINKRCLLALIPDPDSQIITPIIGGTTGNPITVTYGAMTNPTLIFRNADGSNYAGAVNNVDNGTAIVLTGDDNGSGKFADSFSFILKP